MASPVLGMWFHKEAGAMIIASQRWVSAPEQLGRNCTASPALSHVPAGTQRREEVASYPASVINEWKLEKVQNGTPKLSGRRLPQKNSVYEILS